MSPLTSTIMTSKTVRIQEEVEFLSKQNDVVDDIIVDVIDESPIEIGRNDTEFENNFFICCWKRPILKSARTVCFLSAASFGANLLSLILAGSQMSLHLAIEIIVLLIEFICLALLFYALSHEIPRFMKPYIIFGIIWNIFLVFLWLFCLAELFKGSQFDFKVSSALTKIFLPSNRRRHPTTTSTFLTALSMLLALGLTIGINFWLLHIIVLAYFYLQQRRRICPWSPTSTISAPTTPQIKISSNPAFV